MTTNAALSKPMRGCLKWIKMQPAVFDKICHVLSELVSTFILIFLGCMGCIQDAGIPNSNFQMAFNFGVALMIVLKCFGCVSGSHCNPAISIAACIYGILSLPMTIMCIIAQLIGSFCGYGLLTALITTSMWKVDGASHGLCVTAVNSDITVAQAVVIEFLITVVLIFICCGVWDPRNAKYQDAVPVIFGLALAALISIAGPLSGASMNPARTFGPALWNYDFENFWIYWVGPLLGSVFAASTYKIVFRRHVLESEGNDKGRTLEELQHART